MLSWPGYRVWRHEIDEPGKKLKLWVRRKRGSVPVCSGCGRAVETIHESCEREVRDLPVFEFRATVIIELYRLRCPDCGPKMERVEQLPSKAPFAKRFEEAVGQACEAASGRAVGRQFGLPQSTVRAIDLRYLERWSARRKKPPLRQLGVDEIYLGKKQKFVTVVSNLETAEPVFLEPERKKETLDRFFEQDLTAAQRRCIQAACVDMWTPFRLSIEQWLPDCLPQRWPLARSGEGQGLAAAVAMGESERAQTAGVEPAVRVESQADEGVSAEGKPGAALDHHYEGAMMNYLRLPSKICDRGTASLSMLCI